VIDSACIVGGGIAGLATGVALEQRGVSVTVVEQAGELRCFGGALTLWSNAIRVLRELGLESQLRRAGCELDGMEFRSEQGRRLWTMPVRRSSKRAGAPTLLVPRAKLLSILAAELDGSIHFSTRYEGHTESRDTVRVRLRGNGVEACDLLVGADGARSRVRTGIGVGGAAVHTGSSIWVGCSEIRHPMLTAGRPVGTLGRGLRFWMAPMASGETYWYAIVEQSRCADELSDVQRLFDGFHEPIPELIAAALPGSFARADILDRPPSFRWSSARVTLVGDAAHLSRPDVGQGACQSLESAACLAELVTGALPLPAALREYELSRFSRTSHVGTLSRAVAFHGTAGAPWLRELGVAFGFPLFAMPALRWMLGEHS
jgi:2-polyprenyl-6-methoxyphenol hydroxylase-like FAD-dependent oxidoreductase